MKKYLLILGILGSSILFMGQSCVSITGSSQKKSNPTTGPAGMFVSLDKGDTWKQINVLPKADGTKSIAGVSVYRIFDDPSDPRAMYMASRDNGMFFSYDEGATWQQPNSALTSGFIYSIAVHPKNRCVIYVSNGVQILRTDDCSRSWVEIYREARSNVRIVSLVFNSFFPHQIIMAEGNGDILKSEDEGKSWMIVQRLGDKVVEIKTDYLQENVMYAVTQNNGLYKTTDAGTTWVNLKASFSGFSSVLEFRRIWLSPTEAGVIYWISTYGILKSSNAGQSWEALPLITPPGSASIYGFAVSYQNPNEIYYTATISNRSTFYRSEDGGKNWMTKKLPSGQIPTLLRTRSGKDGMLFLGFSIPAN